MHKLVALTALFSALSGTGLSAHAATPLDAKRLLKKSVDAMHFKREEALYSMRLAGPGGENGIRKMQVWFKSLGDDDLKLRIHLTEPADIRGTGFLTLVGAGGKSKQQWLYLPSYRKVRRIGGGNENEPFLDSDFTLEDVSVESKGKFEYQVSGSRKCGAADCYVLTGVPGAPSNTASYAKKVLLIRKDNYLNVRTEFYNAGQKLEKVMTLAKFHRDGATGRWMTDRLEMDNQLTHHTTSLEIEKRISGDPSDALFTQRALEDGK